MRNDGDLLEQLYDRFNTRDITALLAAMHADAAWANGLEGGHAHGYVGVREYWTRQWAVIDPRVGSVNFTEVAGEVTEVEVLQVVRDPRDPGIGRSISMSNNGSINWPTDIFTKWPFCIGHLQNTLRRYADKTEVDPMKLTLSAGLCALLFAGASLIGGYAQAASSLADVITSAVADPGRQ